MLDKDTEIEMTTLELKTQRKAMKLKLKSLRKEQHKELCAKHKKLLRIVDSLFIIAIILHVGAIFLTNVMVMKTVSNTEQYFVEANPAQDDKYVKTPETSKEFIKFAINIIVYAYIIMYYVIIRKMFFNEMLMYMLVGMVLAMLFMLGIDFFNNLGLYVGTVVNNVTVGTTDSLIAKCGNLTHIIK